MKLSSESPFQRETDHLLRLAEIEKLIDNRLLTVRCYEPPSYSIGIRNKETVMEMLHQSTIDKIDDESSQPNDQLEEAVMFDDDTEEGSTDDISPLELSG